jgi:hypothetical protein
MPLRDCPLDSSGGSPKVEVWTYPGSLNVCLEIPGPSNQSHKEDRVLLEFAPLSCKIKGLDTNSMYKAVHQLTAELKRGLLGTGDGTNGSIWGIENFLSRIGNKKIYPSEQNARIALESVGAFNVCQVKGESYIYLFDYVPYLSVGLFVPKECLGIFGPCGDIGETFYQVTWWVQMLYQDASRVVKAYLG